MNVRVYVSVENHSLFDDPSAHCETSFLGGRYTWDRSARVALSADLIRFQFVPPTADTAMFLKSCDTDVITRSKFQVHCGIFSTLILLKLVHLRIPSIGNPSGSSYKF